MLELIKVGWSNVYFSLIFFFARCCWFQSFCELCSLPPPPPLPLLPTQIVVPSNETHTHTHNFFFLPLTVASIPWDNNHFRCWASVDFLWRQSNHFHNVRGWKVSLGAGAQFVRHFALLSNNEHIYMWNTSFVSHILLSSRHHLVVVIVMHCFHPLSLTNSCVRLKTWRSFFLTHSLTHSLRSFA